MNNTMDKTLDANLINEIEALLWCARKNEALQDKIAEAFIAKGQQAEWSVAINRVIARMG